MESQLLQHSAPEPDGPQAAPLKALAWRIVGQGASITRRAGGRPIPAVQAAISISRKRSVRSGPG